MATRSEIVMLALAKLDEMETLTGAEQSPTDALIEKLMDDSTIQMLRNAPIHLLKPVKVNVGVDRTLIHGYDPDTGIGHIVIPTDFLRLYSFKMAAWKRQVTNTINITNPLYDLQKNVFSKGGVNKPILVLSYEDVSDGINNFDVDDNEIAPPA